MELHGREESLAQLDDRLSALEGGAGGVVIVTGEPGIGKTALMRTALDQTREAAAVVLEGRAFDHGVPLPFAPVAHALHRWARGCDRARLARSIEGLPGLELLLPWLSELKGTQSVGLSGVRDPALGRLALFESVTAFVERLTDDAPVVLAIDDLHWADPDTADLLRTITRDVHELPLMLLVAMRDGGIPDDIERLLVDLRRAGPTLELRLERLRPDVVRAVVAERLGRTPSDKELEEVVRLSAGTPLFVEAVTDELRAGRPVDPAGVADLVHRFLDDAPDADHDLATVLALHREPLAPELLAELTGAQPDELSRALSRADDHGLTNATAEGEIHLRHPLFGEAIEARLGELDRRRWHARLAARAEQAGASVELRARHVLGAGDLVAGDDALAVLAEAGSRLLAAGSANEAARLLGRAAELAARHDPARSAEILADLGTAWIAVGEVGASAAALHEALALARQRGDDALVHRCLRMLVDVDWYRGRAEELVALTDVALGELRARNDLDEQHLITSFRMLGHHLRGGDWGSAAGHTERILVLADEVGGPQGRAVRLFGELIRALIEPGSDGVWGPLERMTAFRRSGALAGIPDLEKRLVDVEIDAYLALGRLEILDELEARAVELERVLPTTTWWRRPVARLRRRILEGDLEVDEEVTELEEHLGRGTALPQRRTDSNIALLLVELARRRRDLGVAEQAVELLGEPGPQQIVERRSLDIAQAQRAILAGRPEDERELLGPLVEYPWLALAGVLSRITALELAVALADAESVDRIASVLELLGGPGSAPALEATLARAQLAGDHEGVRAAAEHFGRLGLVSDQHRALALLGDPGPAQPTRKESGELTRRQHEIAELVADGLTNRQIAERLHVSVRTVTSHLDHIYTRLGIGSRTQLAAWIHERR